jgi:endonuclease G
MHFIKSFFKIIAFIFKYPKIMIPVVLVLSVGYWAILIPIKDSMSYQGVPKESRLGALHRVFINYGFMVGYSDIKGVPLWVSYQLSPLPSNAQAHTRPPFHDDWRALNRVYADDYTHSGYDRGHMAPNFAMDRLYGREGQRDSFLMTNIVPQTPNLNRKIWQRLEEMEIKRFARIYDTLWVYTGPLFAHNTKRLSTSFKVQLPDAFYKIYVGVKRGQMPKMLSFIFPQNLRGHEPLWAFVSSVDKIEALSGLDFFHKLEDHLENRLEKIDHAKGWGLRR